jgi:hypothetical protein
MISRTLVLWKPFSANRWTAALIIAPRVCSAGVQGFSMLERTSRFVLEVLPYMLLEVLPYMLSALIATVDPVRSDSSAVAAGDKGGISLR